jgi:flagellar biosynthesis component FlhA
VECPRHNLLQERTTTEEDKDKEKTMKKKLPFIAAAVLVVTTRATAQREVSQQAVERIQKEVRHEILMLPYFDVFDNITFKVEGYDVTLSGQVARPTLKTDAERVVKRIEGVEKVDNQIEVLPVSPNDDRIRIRAFRAIYGLPGTPALCLAGHQADPDHCQERSHHFGRGRGQ